MRQCRLRMVEKKWDSMVVQLDKYCRQIGDAESKAYMRNLLTVPSMVKSAVINHYLRRCR